jgi:rRNA-processing protein FCF1
MVATVDYELKRRIKKSGGSVLSLANNRILLEP